MLSEIEKNKNAYRDNPENKRKISDLEAQSKFMINPFGGLNLLNPFGAINTWDKGKKQSSAAISINAF